MHSDFDPEEIPLNLEQLIDDAVAEALRVQDPRRFLDWLRDRIYDYSRIPTAGRQGDLFTQDSVPQDDPLELLAIVLGRQLWNAIPLPGNDFRPRPLAEPGRNEACFCGSGRKFKQCCARLPRMPGPDLQELWPIVLQHLGPDDRARAIARKRIPVDALAVLAIEHSEAGSPRKGVKSL